MRRISTAAPAVAANSFDVGTPPAIVHNSPVPAHAMQLRKLRRSIPSLACGFGLFRLRRCIVRRLLRHRGSASGISFTGKSSRDANCSPPTLFRRDGNKFRETQFLISRRSRDISSNQMALLPWKRAVREAGSQTSTFEELALPLLPCALQRSLLALAERNRCGGSGAGDIFESTSRIRFLRARLEFQGMDIPHSPKHLSHLAQWPAAQRTVSLEEQLEEQSEFGPPVYPEAAIDRATPEVNLIRSTDRATLHSAMEKLPAPLLEVILLCDVEEMKYKEIAAVLDLPIGTVMSRIARARAALRNLFEADTAVHRGVPRMTTHLSDTTLNSLVDGELSAEQSASAKEHLDQCPACTSSALSQALLKTATAKAGQRYAVPTQLQERLRRLAASQEMNASGSQHNLVSKTLSVRRIAALALPIAALLLLLASSSLLLARYTRNSQRASIEDAALVTEISDLHIATLATNQPPEVISSDRHTVKPWFQGKLPVQLQSPRESPGRYATRRCKPHLSSQSCGGAASLQHRRTSRVRVHSAAAGRSNTNSQPRGARRLSRNRLRYQRS